ncbi:MAG: hypothetical protein PVS3B3_34580 [Ktedonobacteraceae bacterium]
MSKHTFYATALLDLAFFGRLTGTPNVTIADRPSTLSTKQLLLKIKKRSTLAHNTQKTFPPGRRRAGIYSLKL